MNMPIVALDLETSWLNPSEDGIIEIALIKFDEDTIIEEFSALVNPGYSLSPEIVHLTGITDAELADAPYFSAIREKVAAFIGDCPVLGHNVEFDLNFLKNNGVDLSANTQIDTFKLGQLFFYQERSMNLGHLSEAIGMPFEWQHRALEDTRATMLLYRYIAKHIDALSDEQRTILSFVYSLPGSNPFWTSALPFMMQPVSLTQIKDIILAHIGEYKKQDRITIPDIHETFLDIIHATKNENTEDRPEQLRMAETIDEAFKKHTLHLIEAPTGIGKTFAYLIPAILHSLSTGKQVFVSTNTKTLQDQIVYKDVPLLREMFIARDSRYAFSVAKVKGRRNYLGLLSFFDFLEGDSFEEYEILCVGKILMWLLETRDGELDELNFYGKEFELLKTISADDRRVLEAWNPFKNFEFLYKARSSAKDANIVIVNHALLTQDTEDEASKILPDVEYLVVDEAHNLENVATESFKHTSSLQMLETTFASLDHALKRYKKTHPDDEFVVADFAELRESIFLYYSMLLESLGEYVSEKSGNGFFAENSERSWASVLIEDDFYTREYIASTGTILQLLLHKTHLLIDILYKSPEPLFRKIEKFVSDLDAHVTVLQKIFSPDTSSLIKILSRNDRGEIYAQYTFLSIGNILRDRLWLKLQTAILTSATLQVGQSFAYIQKTLGADQFHTLELASDFDYAKQALVFLPSDIGDIRNAETRKQANDFIFDLIKIVGGRTLCLFTSFSAMKETFVQIHSSMKEIGIELLTQGIWGSKQKLLESFKKNASRSVLFGTDSFWEGVDIPGSDVELLVIHKFPFMVPTDPIFQARSKLFRDSFLEYSVPAMILKLKQGIWRLIRTKTDKGIIVILDRRIDSRWGSTVRESFPAGIPVRSGLSGDFLKLLSSKR